MADCVSTRSHNPGWLCKYQVTQPWLVISVPGHTTLADYVSTRSHNPGWLCQYQVTQPWLIVSVPGHTTLADFVSTKWHNPGWLCQYQVTQPWLIMSVPGHTTLADYFSTRSHNPGWSLCKTLNVYSVNLQVGVDICAVLMADSVVTGEVNLLNCPFVTAILHTLQKG